MPGENPSGMGSIGLGKLAHQTRSIRLGLVSGVVSKNSELYHSNSAAEASPLAPLDAAEGQGQLALTLWARGWAVVITHST